MGGFSGLFGLAGGQSGTGISGPNQASIQQGITAGNVQQSQDQANRALSGQQALINAINNQRGFDFQNASMSQNQALATQLARANGTGSAQNALSQQQGFNSQLNAAGGIGTQNQAIAGLQGLSGQQQGLANQYANIAAGRGPNPAQAALNQSTGQNVANQAALMASQRGAGANVGLLARQAAQQGAATQQQAVGQGATLQAQQEMNALQGIGAQQAAQAQTQQAIGSLGTTQAGMQQAGISQQAQQAQAEIAAQQAANTAAAGQANQLVGQQTAAQNAYNQAALTNAAQQQQALAAYNQALVGSQSSLNTANSGLAQQQMKGQQGIIGGALNSIGGAVGLAGGGQVHKMAAGGPMVSQGPLSSFGQFLQKSNTSDDSTDDNSLQKGTSQFIKGVGTALAAKGGLAKSGGHVNVHNSSQKAEKKGNSYDNDKVPAMLSEGEIVLPRSVTMSKDPIKASSDFVSKVLAKRKVCA